MSGPQALIYVLQTLGQLYILLILLRFVLQLVRADFYNPLSQFVVKATQPLLLPLRRIVPGFGGIDLASLVLAWLVHMALSLAIFLIAGAPAAELPPLLAMLALWCLISLASLFVKIFFFALIISVILSWVAQGSRHPAVELVHQVCAPVLSPIRRFLPDLGGIDISPIFAFLALNLLDKFVIANLAIQTRMPAIISPFM
ncbi:YggT family protein [Thiopseudomonas denitrificans]|uniref:YggT family protein n=1 Tax=Thiopseudomonas denitrificans TaxID=1501432 RepID=A0A4R6TXG6_9GAMM|nr:YggT family protein [Thiopseudomonas denitrificans]TDQ37043.1 YggT family protein [Thiopseudomonas denitrificans]